MNTGSGSASMFTAKLTSRRRRAVVLCASGHHSLAHCGSGRCGTDAGTAGTGGKTAVAAGAWWTEPATGGAFDGCRSRDFCISAIHDKGDVKQVLDLKGPLKGKGGTLTQWRAEAAVRLAQIHRDMEVLAAGSKSIEGRTWSLNVYKARGSWQVRWRMTNGQHTTWAAISALLATLAPGLARWYRLTEDAAQLLNHREQAARYEANTVARLASRQRGTSV